MYLEQHGTYGKSQADDNATVLITVIQIELLAYISIPKHCLSSGESRLSFRGALTLKEMPTFNMTAFQWKCISK